MACYAECAPVKLVSEKHVLAMHLQSHDFLPCSTIQIRGAQKDILSVVTQRLSAQAVSYTP